MKILYICTHNRCRSILSEAITNHLSGGKIQAYSAGSQPAGQIHPLTLKYLCEKGIQTQGLKSQSWDDFESDKPGVVVTVCDSAASETCPIWFADTFTVHWALPDPSKHEGAESAVRDAFYTVMTTIEQRVEKLLNLDLVNIQGAERLSALKRLTSSM